MLYFEKKKEKEKHHTHVSLLIFFTLGCHFYNLYIDGIVIKEKFGKGSLYTHPLLCNRGI